MNKTDSQAFYTDLEAQFVRWARSEENIRAAFVVGSRARQEHGADEWSDLDIILFARNPEDYLDRLDWIEAFHPIWLTLQQKTVAGDPERLVIFAGGYQTDFVIQTTAVLQGIPQMLASGNLPDTIRRGTRVLLDKDGDLAQMPPPSPIPARRPPSPEEFAGFVEHFWFYALYIAKQLGRGDLLSFQGGLHGLRWMLVDLMDWHSRARCGWDLDTWHAGRFLQTWADPQTYAELALTYPPFDQAASWKALLAALQLFRRLEQETASALGMDAPRAVEDEVWAFFQALYQEHGAPVAE